MTALMAASFIGLTWWNACALDQKDAERVRAEEATRNREAELRRAYEALAEADRHKDEFLAVASHELRTPLNAILGYVSFLQEGDAGPLNPEQQAFADRAMEGVDGLAGLVDDIVGYARIVSGRLTLDQAPTEYAALVDGVATELRLRAEARRLELLIDVQLDACPVLDAYHVAQVLRKLLDNAIKFSGEGGRITVRARRRGDELFTEVADPGPGVDEAQRERIFAPFSQADMSATRAAGGLGLGLPICRGIVEAHGGMLGVDAVAGTGSTFWFVLPAFQGPEGRQIPS